MMLGKEVRLNRILNTESKRFVAITIDHPMGRGVLPGLVDIKSTMAKIVAGEPNAITMQKGIAENVFAPYAGKIPFILKATSFSPYHFEYDTPTADVEEAVRLGADAISVGVIVGSEQQAAQISNLARVSKEAAAVGMPLLAHIYPRGSMVEDAKSVEALSYAVRLGAELGVDYIKTTWSGSAETFAKVVAACPTNVVIAGGNPGNSLESYLQMTWDGIQAGVAGVTYGRFVWGDKNPAAVIAALKHIVHQGASVKEALQLYSEISQH